MTEQDKDKIKKTISKEIVDEIVAIFENNIKNELSEIKSQVKSYQNKINNVIQDLNSNIKHSKQAIKDIKQDGFTAILVEEEGYLRGIISALNTLDMYKLKIK